jgi:hypothetical protein
MKVIENVMYYFVELEYDFVNLLRNLRYVECTETEQKNLDDVMRQINHSLYDLEKILKEIQEHFEE